MPRSPRIIIPLLLSLAIHVMALGAVFLLSKEKTPLPATTPVRVVNLPREVLRGLPPVQPPSRSLPAPKRFGTDEDVRVPRTAPPSEMPDEKGGGGARDNGGAKDQEKGPLPFLTQRDIDELARRGMPPKRPGDESVTLDTDQFKFISYNRWLKVKVESILRFPELAAISGYQGVAFIRFDIMKDGSLGALELLKSSGYKILDNEALRSIRSAAPFQPLPDEWHMERYPIRAAVIFYINEAYVR